MQQPTDQFDVRQKLAVLSRSRSLLILFCTSAMVSSLALTYIYSERYRAVTTVTYRPTEAVRFQARELQSLGFPVPLLPFEAIGQTISHIGTSEVVLRQVVERLGLDQPDTKQRTGFSYLFHETKQAVKKFGRRTWELLKHGRFIDANRTSSAIIGLAKNVTIDTSRKDFTATVTVVDKFPERAAAIVDVLGETLFSFMHEENSRFARTQGEELDRLLGKKQQEIDTVRQQIEALKTEGKFVSLREEVSLNLQSIEKFEGKLRVNEEELMAARARYHSIRRQRESLVMMAKSSETRTEDPLYKQLRTMQTEREVVRQGLLKKVPSHHPDVEAIDAELAQIDKQMAAAQPTRVTDETTRIDDVYQKTLADELEAKAEVAGLEAARESLQKTVRELHSQFKSPSVQTRLDDLTQKLRVLEATYHQLATARAESRIAELESQGEIRVLHKATPQDAPFRPIKIYHVLLSGILALLIGVGVAYLVDFWLSLWGRTNSDDPGYPGATDGSSDRAAPGGRIYG